MKKIIALLSAAVLLFTLSACKESKKTSTGSKKDKVYPNGTTAHLPEDKESVGNEIDVEIVGTVTGSGTVVQKVTVAESGATVIKVSKKNEGGSSSDSSGNQGSSGDSTTPEEGLSTLGLDYVLEFDTDDITILQLTDFRIFDSTQQRTVGALNAQFTEMYKPEKMQELLFDHIKTTIEATKPDLILVSGNLVQGQFDDLGKSFKAVVNYLDSFKIFWAPVFGNLDNISAQGVEWQCKQFENAAYCLFKRNNAIGGNSNYTIGIGVNDTLTRVIYMMDSNGCQNSTEDAVISSKGLSENQRKWLKDTAASVAEKNGSAVPSFACFSIPSSDVTAALIGAGYETAENAAATYTIGTDVTAKNGDVGTKGAAISAGHTVGTLADLFKEVGVDGVFMGNNPASDFSVLYDGIRWTVGRKTGKYDTSYGLNGGTLITLSNGNAFKVSVVD